MRDLKYPALSVVRVLDGNKNLELATDWHDM